ncbi:MAG: hypothetical protein V4699_02150 [Patescibacteria group bacterium]
MATKNDSGGGILEEIPTRKCKIEKSVLQEKPEWSRIVDTTDYSTERSLPRRKQG